MHAEPIATDHFEFDGRGPSLIRWLYASDLVFAGTFPPDIPDDIRGGEYGIPPIIASGPGPSMTISVVDPLQCSRAWVVFDGLQVIQVVPEEVHAYWFLSEDESHARTGVWEVLDSEWLASFSQLHLAGHKHFVIEFYDDLVEVIARDLIFGRGEFLIDRAVGADGRFAYAYFRRADVREKARDWPGAIADYRAYANVEPNWSNAKYGLALAEALEAKLR